MKVLIKILALAVVLYAGACIPPPKASAQETSVSFQLFYDQLSPYGSWVEYQNYGYVWIPDVDREFSPYGTDGHWVFTDDGWTWVSDYSWGWAPFHYGRWAYDDSYGWLWVPHNEWGPAWVTWRRSEGYYGWAPMGPGISVEVSFGGGYRVPNERWIFVSDRDISRPDIDRHYVDRSTNVTIINNSTVINNTYVDNSRHTKYVAGPARADVQKVTGAAIRPVVIRENDKPGQIVSNDQLQIYRPRVQMGNTNDRKPVPSKLVSLKEVKPVSERKHGNQRRDENPAPKGNEQSSQPQNAGPPAMKGAVEQPRVVNPPEKNKSDERPVGTQPPNPSDNKGRGQKPRVDIPPEKNKSDERPVGTQPPNPSDNKGRGQKPPVVTPPEKNKSIEEPSPPQNAEPSARKGRGQQPRMVNPPDKNKNIGQPSPPPNAIPPGKKGEGEQPRVVNPPDRNKNVDQQSQPRNARQPKGKRVSPKPPAPPNDKGGVREPQPPKPDKQKKDSTNSLSQQ